MKSGITLCSSPPPAKKKPPESAASWLKNAWPRCANITGRIRSIYRWQDAIEDEAECLMILKTSQASLDALIARANELHSYDVPEIIALPIHQGYPPYLKWIAENA